MNIDRKVVLEPTDLWWEAKGVFNPGIAEYGDKIYMLYRALGKDNISRFGLAVSQDGEKFERFKLPVLEGDELNPYERLGIEDPRIVKIGRDFYVTYTAASVYPASHPGPFAPSLNTSGTPWRVRTSALRTRDFRSFERLGVIITDLDTKNSALFNRRIQGKYWLLHRVLPSIYVSVSNKINKFVGGFQLLASQEEWENAKIGAACPPIETARGWLLFYHAVSKEKIYSIGAVLLDKENPAFVIARTKRPIFKPELSWEKKGYVNNVVFVTGSIERRGSVWLYYGGGDRVVGLGKIPLDAVFEHLSS